MKMLLTSGGIKNESIHAALVDLLGKPIAECDALCITTASYGYTFMGPGLAYKFVTKTADTPMLGLGWKSMGLLELSVLSTLGKENWAPLVHNADVLLVNGGETMFLAHWLRESGLAEMLPTLDIVWVGLSAGSVVMAPRIGHNFVHWPEEGGKDEGLGLIDFAIFPHLNWPGLPTHSLDHAKAWAESLETPGYAIDEDTAISVVDGETQVISEGEWHYFAKEQPSR